MIPIETNIQEIAESSEKERKIPFFLSFTIFSPTESGQLLPNPTLAYDIISYLATNFEPFQADQGKFKTGPMNGRKVKWKKKESEKKIEKEEMQS